MKKSILSATLALALLVGFNVNAQTPEVKPECAKTVCKKDACKKDKPDCKKADCRKAECAKPDCKKADCQKAECAKPDCKKADCQKAECVKPDCKKADCQKAECAKPDMKKGDRHHMRRHGEGHRNHAAMFEGVNLTEEQKARLKELREGQHADFHQMTPEQRKEAFEAHQAKIKEILTPEQYAIFEQNIAKAQAEKFDGRTRIAPADRKLGDGAKAEGRKLRDGAKAEGRKLGDGVKAEGRKLDKGAKKAVKGMKANGQELGSEAKEAVVNEAAKVADAVE